MYEDKAKIFKTSVESLYISRGQNNMVPMRDKYFWRFLILFQNNKNWSDLQGKYPNEILDGNKYLWKNICIVKVLDVLGRGKGAEYIINVIYYISSVFEKNIFLTWVKGHNKIYITYMWISSAQNISYANLAHFDLVKQT